MSRIIMVVLIVLVVGGVYAYSSRPSSTQTTQESNSATSQTIQEEVIDGPSINIAGGAHSPAVLTVKPGEVVTVTNMDIAGHSVTSDTAGLFDTGIVSKGKSVTFTAPMGPGDYPYHCTPHPSMTGVLVVEG